MGDQRIEVFPRQNIAPAEDIEEVIAAHSVGGVIDQDREIGGIRFAFGRIIRYEDPWDTPELIAINPGQRAAVADLLGDPCKRSRPKAA